MGKGGRGEGGFLGTLTKVEAEEKRGGGRGWRNERSEWVVTGNKGRLRCRIASVEDVVNVIRWRM